MREGLLPATASHLMRFDTDEAGAKATSLLLGELLDAENTAVSAFEADDGKTWAVEVYFAREPDEEAMRSLVEMALSSQGAAFGPIRFAALDQRDWVQNSLEGLAPVRAGRFVVHGAHDRGKVRPHEIAIEIEAALAFGTGHHGTTRGCLLAIDGLLKRRRPAQVIDVGTGTGVLAIAMAKRLRRQVAAGDIDPVATETARSNARHNGAGPWLRPVTARGVAHPALSRARAFDVTVANILARPLRLLAPALAHITAMRGVLILSGLLERDVPGVLTAYRAQGFTLVRRTLLDGWATLILRRGGQSPRPV
jgi:ribosomal protein L11 methyltransferase